MKKQAPIKTLWKKAKKDGSDDEVRGLGGAVGAVSLKALFPQIWIL
jgi:hypothetical protein